MLKTRKTTYKPSSTLKLYRSQAYFFWAHKMTPDERGEVMISCGGYNIQMTGRSNDDMFLDRVVATRLDEVKEWYKAWESELDAILLG